MGCWFRGGSFLHSCRQGGGGRCMGITQTLIPDTLAVKPKASQSADGNLLWSVVYICDTVCLRVGMANDTQPAFSRPTPVKAALASHWRICCRCPLTVSRLTSFGGFHGFGMHCWAIHLPMTTNAIPTSSLVPWIVALRTAPSSVDGPTTAIWAFDGGHQFEAATDMADEVASDGVWYPQGATHPWGFRWMVPCSGRVLHY
jgi:hypothetical protein